MPASTTIQVRAALAIPKQFLETLIGPSRDLGTNLEWSHPYVKNTTPSLFKYQAILIGWRSCPRGLGVFTIHNVLDHGLYGVLKYSEVRVEVLLSLLLFLLLLQFFFYPSSLSEKVAVQYSSSNVTPKTNPPDTPAPGPLHRSRAIPPHRTYRNEHHPRGRYLRLHIHVFAGPPLTMGKCIRSDGILRRTWSHPSTDIAIPRTQGWRCPAKPGVAGF